MSTNDGGPAYPVKWIDWHNQGVACMTLRDHFAGLAMQGMIAEGAKLDIHDEVLGLSLARVAYAIADAMLAAREQRT